MIKRFLYALLISLILASSVLATDYSYYFATGGSGTICSEGSPCAFTYMQTKLDAYSSSGNTLTLYMNKGDTWTFTSNSNILEIDKSNVTIDAYGAGADPIISGNNSYPTGVTDSNVPYNWAIMIGTNDNPCENVSIKNIDIINMYPGGGIAFFGSGTGKDFTGTGLVEGCTFTHLGWSAITVYEVPNSSIEITNNTVSQAGEWPKDSESGRGWPQAIHVRKSTGVEVRYNTVYNCYTEGIGADGCSIVEYNNVSDTQGPGIYFDAAGETYTGTVAIRYNLIWADSDGANSPSSVTGIRLHDEKLGVGTNTGLTIEIYGNIVVGGFYAGIQVQNPSGNSHWGSVKVYNNTIIDTQRNIVLDYPAEFNAIDIRNNISVVNSDIAGSAVHLAVWHTGTYPGSTTIGPNFWYGDGYTSESNLPADWRDGTNVFGSQPFIKTSGWRSLTTTPAMSNFTTSGLGDADNNTNAANLGASYDDYVSSSTTDEWSDLPAGDTFDLADQDVVGGANWTFGAVIYSAGASPDEDNPTPDPATISSVDASVANQLTIHVDAQTDDSPPVTTVYTLDNTDCGADAGAGGTGCGATEDDSCLDDGLEINQCYGFKAQHTDNADPPNTGTVSAVTSTYTIAAVPGLTTFTAVDTTTAEIYTFDINENPTSTPATLCAVQVVTTSPSDTSWLNKWVGSDSEPNSGEQWLTQTQIQAIDLGSGGTALNASTLYGLKSKCRNGDDVPTALSAESQFTTSDPPPPGDATWNNITFSGIKITN